MTAPEPERRHTVAEIAADTGLSERTTRRFFRALGFPDAGPDARYTDADRAVLVQLVEAVQASDAADMPTVVRLVRAVGQNVARLSDWQVAALATRAEQLSQDDPDACSRHDAAVALAGDLDRALRDVLVHSWQRHLEAALARLDVPELDEDSAVVTVGFADLVSFSALSNELDTGRLGDLVELFEARCGDVVAASEGRMVKTLGDSVLFLVEGDDGADRALSIARGLIEVIGRDPRLPDVRIGLATGPVVTRMGDVFGPPVNLAARLTAIARRNRVLTDDATVAALTPGGHEARRLTARPLRGFGLVEPVAVRPVPRR